MTDLHSFYLDFDDEEKAKELWDYACKNDSEFEGYASRNQIILEDNVIYSEFDDWEGLGELSDFDIDYKLDKFFKEIGPADYYSFIITCSPDARTIDEQHCTFVVHENGKQVYSESCEGANIPDNEFFEAKYYAKPYEKKDGEKQNFRWSNFFSLGKNEFDCAAEFLGDADEESIKKFADSVDGILCNNNIVVFKSNVFDINCEEFKLGKYFEANANNEELIAITKKLFSDFRLIKTDGKKSVGLCASKKYEGMEKISSNTRTL